MTKRYFGTDGIRGRANAHPMTADVALRVAMATARVLRGRAESQTHTNRAIIGKDTRLSGYMLEEAMAAGFVSMGMDVVLVGPIPTPGIAMLTRSLRAEVGVMISASHNPFEDNGIKLFGADGFKLDDALELSIEAAIEGDVSSHLALPGDLGKASRLDDALGRYIEYIKAGLPRGQTLKGMKVVVDCAHGAAYKVAPQILWELEADVVAIGVSPNGRNINDGYGATATQHLEQTVLEQRADIGLALDGDADRLIVVDETGARVDGDQIMAALAAAWQDKGRLSRPGIVSTIMSNLGLERFLRTRGLDLVRTKVGDRYVVEAMREGGYNLGGEQSGHVILSDFGTTGDGLLCALQLLSLMKERGEKASSLFSVFAPLPQILRNVKFKAGAPLEREPVKKVIAEAEKKLSGTGRILVRPSGTEPVIRVMAEGEDARLIETLVADICGAIERAA